MGDCAVIVAYHRPTSLDEALRLLRRPAPRTRPVAGGLFLMPQARATANALELVDVQELGLSEIEVVHGRTLRAGAALSLQGLLEAPALPEGLAAAIRRTFPLPQRGQATVAGSLMAANGTSPWAAASMALDAIVHWAPGADEASTPWGDIYALRERYRQPGWLITAVTWPLTPQVRVETIARSPADRPLVLVAVARWPRGRVRMVVGGWGAAPRLVLDGPSAAGWEVALQEALAQADDSRASAAYRRAAASTLAQRALQAVGA